MDGPANTMTVSGGRYAVARFELKEDEFAEAWDLLVGGWLPQSGYQPADGPYYELYHNNPEEHPERIHILDICIPVKPL